MATYRILFLGDIVGRPGRDGVLGALPLLQQKYRPLFTIVNGENAASGVGITPDIATKLLSSGVDAITLGNHAFHKREITDFLNSGRPIVRPANMPPKTAGRGVVQLEKAGIKLMVANLCGRVYMDPYDDPFRCIDTLMEQSDGPHWFIDFHAEATSEKQAFGFYLDGRAAAVVGTHTHIPTADAQILPKGTAYITDVGMCGPYPSVLGTDKEIVLKKFLTNLPARFEVAEAPSVISGVVVDVYKDTGTAANIVQILEGRERTSKQ